MSEIEAFIWSEKYRPHTLEECILPEEIKETFAAFIKQGNIPHLLLSGTQGTGKTSVAKAVLEELEYDYIVINGSMNGNIDTLRNEILQFASSMSLTGDKKAVLIDEADYLGTLTQSALRNFLETYSSCKFIFTANFKNRIIEPLHSRCACIDFKIPKKELPNIASQFMKRIIWILEKEEVEYDKKVIVELITKYLPDWRRLINELQRYSATGKIDTGILVNLSDDSFQELIKAMKEKKFNLVRKWVGENSDADTAALFRKFYDYSVDLFTPDSIPQLILHLAEYGYRDAFCTDKEINIAAALLSVLVDCEFK